MFKTYRIYFGTKNEDQEYKPNRIEVVVTDGKTFWINCLLKIEGESYEYFSFKGDKILTKKDFILI